MTRYIWKDGRFVGADGQPMPLPERDGVAMPRVIGDIPAYRSPVTGEWVDGRSARREDLKRNDCIDAGDLPRLNGGKVRNKDFARKHGLRWEGE